MDHIVLAFVAGLAGFAGGCFAAKRDEIVGRDGLCADEALFEIGVDDPRRLGRLGADWDGPGARLLRPGGEIGDQVLELIARADEAVEARFLQAQVGQIFGALFRIETGHFRLDLR